MIHRNSVCLAHAFTTLDFNNGVLGLAFVGTLCNQRRKSCLHGSLTLKHCTSWWCKSEHWHHNQHQFWLHKPHSTDGQWSLVECHLGVLSLLSSLQWLQTLVFAHEVGHNFGMLHDTDCSSGVEPGGLGNFIMFPVSVDGSQANNDEFSQCSKDAAESVRILVSSLLASHTNCRGSRDY